MPHLPWLPPNEMEGVWRAELAKLTDEALAEEVGRLLTVDRHWVARGPRGVVPVAPADPLGYNIHDLT